MRTREAVAVTKAEAARPGLEELKRLRQEQLETLAQATADDTALVNGIVTRIQSLSAAIDLIEKAKIKTRDRRLTIAAWGSALLLAGTLLLLHRPSAEVLVDAKSTHVALRVTEPFAPLAVEAQAASVVLSRLTKIRQEGSAEIVAGPDEDLLSLRVEPDPGSKAPGSIGFNSLTIPAGTHVEFIQLSDAIELRFQYPSGATPTLDLDVTGDLVIRSNGQRSKVSFLAPARITAVPADYVQLVVKFRSPDVVFHAPVRVGSVSWSRDPNPGEVRRESAIIDGKLSFEEFRDRTVNLRNGERLHLGGESGAIRLLRSDGQALFSQFDGAAKELSIGEGKRSQNLMPTWLEWVRQQDALVQFWALAGFLSALGLGVGRWLRNST
jgi:hypothetical protein